MLQNVVLGPMNMFAAVYSLPISNLYQIITAVIVGKEQ
jgi:hypothetical protein